MYFVVSGSEKSANHNTSLCTEKCLKGALDGRLQCNCGEDIDVFDWTWQDLQSANIKMSNSGKEVLFHPVYSSGTAAVRGQVPFQQNYHYYWEIKMISKLYGTDVMIGVGTSKVILQDWQFKFCSLLGIDSESWGYSYHGSIQHNKLRRKYGAPYGLSSIIGVHLDMCNGTLEYFLNRKSLGIAFKDLKGKELYPMICSTAAQSSMRIICSMSKESSLQMMSLKHIMQHPPLYQYYKSIPGLSKIYDREFFWIQPKPNKEAEERKRLAELDDDVALNLADRSYVIKFKKIRAIRLIPLLYDQDGDRNSSSDDFDIYDMSDLNKADSVSKVTEEKDKPSTSTKTSNTEAATNSGQSSHFKTRARVDSDDSDSDLETFGLTEII